MFKNKSNKSAHLIKKTLYIMAFFLFTSQLSALSFKDFLLEKIGINKTQSKEEYVSEENVQKMNVFEADKTFLEVVKDTPNLPKFIDNSDSALIAGEDNFNLGADEVAPLHGDNTIYKVQKGDTIYSIATYLGISVDTIVKYNKKTNKTVTVGEILEVPSESGVLYAIKSGDTLSAISKKYSIEVDDVILFNGLLESDELSAGDEIFLPGAKEIAIAVKNNNEKSTKGVKTTTTKKGVVSGLVAQYIPKSWVRGDTSHLNTSSSVNKFMNLPKYPGYYTYPAPGTNRTQKMHGHNSVDLAGKVGTPVVAAAGGTVRVAKSSGYNYGYGNYVIISHSNGSETLYAHMSSVGVVPGQSVGSGARIGAVGNSGNSTGPHLHFEIRGAYNPWAW